MLEKNKLTVGLPIYNEEKTIKKTLDSIMNNIDDIDYVLIADNNSTDSTDLICREYSNRCDKIVYSRNLSNIGAWQNMMKLLKGVSTEFYMQLGGHDCLSPNSIKKLRSEMKEDTVCCFGRVKNQIDDNPIEDTYIQYKSLLSSGVNSDRFISYLLTGGVNCAFYGIMRTDSLKQASLFIGDYRGFDADNLIIAHMSLEGKLKYMPEVEIEIVSRAESEKEAHNRYRRYGLDVPYVNPGKRFYRSIMNMVSKVDDLNLRKKEVERALNKSHGAYGTDFKWFMKKSRYYLWTGVLKAVKYLNSHLKEKVE